MTVLHLADTQLWSDAQRTGRYTESTRGMDLEQVGFLHACTPAQLPGVIARFYADADPADFRLLVLDLDRCEAEGTPVRWDPVGDDHFPHLYGPLPLTAVTAVLPIGAGWQLPDLPEGSDS